MIKRTLLLVLTASVITAGLLIVGITVMGQFSPAVASPIEALVAGINPQASDRRGDDEARTSESRRPIASTSQSGFGIQLSTPQAGTTTAPAGILNISQLLSSPTSFISRNVTVSGVASSLNGEYFLLNDGTGQILVKIDLDDDDNISGYVPTSGATLTVFGEFEQSSSGWKVEACTITDANGTFVVDDCSSDDDDDRFDDDDSSGRGSGDDDDDRDDDNSGSGSGDDDDDDNDDDSDDDDDDHSGSGSGSDDDDDDDDYDGD